MVDHLSFFKPRRPNLLQIGQIRHQSTPLYLYIQNIDLVCHFDLLWDELGQESGVYTPRNTKAMVDRLSFFKPRRPNLLQIAQIRHQSTPLYLYIQNINLVCHSDLLWDNNLALPSHSFRVYHCNKRDMRNSREQNFTISFAPLRSISTGPTFYPWE